MEFKFGKKQMKEVLEQYYSKYEDFDGKVTAGCRLGAVGYGMSEHEDVIYSIKIAGKLHVCGVDVPMLREINDEEVMNAFKTMLGNQGYTVSSITFNAGVNESCEGYGMGEHTVRRPYFNGVVVTVKEKQLVR